ncbi:MAG: hypothetical protein IJP92_02130 [Lachnospiraceae bacterium]|nr:hypothetical protein [Lachnospiraceae bacterium]
MEAVQGYYDGAGIRLLEKVKAKPNQKVVVTIMDEFIVPERPERKKSMFGALSKYANPELMKQEKGAWARAVVKKHGHS